MAEYTQEYLDILSKEQRGELWIQGVLAKEPDYNVDRLHKYWNEAWDKAPDVVENLEQTADKIKYLCDRLQKSLDSGFVEYDSVDNFIKVNDQRRAKIHQKVLQRQARQQKAI